MITPERKLVVTAAWTLSVLGAWSIVQRAAQAEEVSPPPRQVRVELKVTGPGIPGLAKLPVLGRLFVNDVKTDSDCCVKKTVGADGLERIGIDFNEVCAHGKEQVSCEKCDVAVCPACPATTKVAVNANANCKTCTATSCPVGLSACCQNSECVVQTAAANEKCVGDEPCQKLACVVSSQIADLVAENVALESALEAKEQMLHLQSELMERFATMMAEKVQLQAQLEFSQKLFVERESARQKIQELAQENSKLKNMVEIAAARHEAEQAKVELAQENQRLKDRVAELEIATRDAKTGVRVAKKPRDAKTEK